MRLVGSTTGTPPGRDHTQAPLLDAIETSRSSHRYGFIPPGHRAGRAVDERVLAILGTDPFADDLPASGGLDDRLPATSTCFMPSN